jgi:hypothetical protein
MDAITAVSLLVLAIAAVLCAGYWRLASRMGRDE